MELLLNEPRLQCVVQIFPKKSCILQNLVLKATYLHSYVVMEHIVVLLVDPSPNLASSPLLTIEVETLTLSWAISDALAHLTYVLAWDKWVISYQILKKWICPFVFYYAVIVSSVILMFVEDQYCLSLQYPHVFFASSIESLSPHHH